MLALLGHQVSLSDEWEYGALKLLRISNYCLPGLAFELALEVSGSMGGYSRQKEVQTLKTYKYKSTGK